MPFCVDIDFITWDGVIRVLIFVGGMLMGIFLKFVFDYLGGFGWGR